LEPEGNNDEGFKGAIGIRIDKFSIETGPPVLITSSGKIFLEPRILSKASSRVIDLKSCRISRIPSRKGEFLPGIMCA
jgi:hypothetical protein